MTGDDAMVLRIALIQMNAQDDKAANLVEARSLIEDAVASERPDMVVLPEMFTNLGGGHEGRLAAAEQVPDGEACRMLQDLAVRHRIAIHGGSLIERDGERIYNTTIVFGRDGNELARYRKIHLFDVVTPDGKVWRESDTFSRGDAIVTYDFEGATIGCSICYDLRFPEIYQALAQRGADVLMVPSNFTLMTGKDHWEPLLRARAIETQCYVAAPAQWGTYSGGRRASYGHSLVVDPWGHVIARAPDKIGVVGARIYLAYLRQVREMIPVARHKVLASPKGFEGA